ncbi:hypothetical protein QCA50_005587 [Cerrena zonata]|uniref:Uncharacterized protein n=1 Tax=Cerrena zonata TaxID=2478898 RepID=A0AAW0GLI3_9APHY
MLFKEVDTVCMKGTNAYAMSSNASGPSRNKLYIGRFSPIAQTSSEICLNLHNRAPRAFTTGHRWSTLLIIDKARDLVVFLNIIYSHGKENKDVSVPMGWVSAVLKLGRKYQVSFIADEAIDRLKRAYPPTVT